jgi:hypothetical protein
MFVVNVGLREIQAKGMEDRAATDVETEFSAAYPRDKLLSANKKGIIPQLSHGGTARCVTIQRLSRFVGSRVDWVVSHGSGQASFVC